MRRGQEEIHAVHNAILFENLIIWFTAEFLLLLKMLFKWFQLGASNQVIFKSFYQYSIIITNFSYFIHEKLKYITFRFN